MYFDRSIRGEDATKRIRRSVFRSSRNPFGRVASPRLSDTTSSVRYVHAQTSSLVVSRAATVGKGVTRASGPDGVSYPPSSHNDDHNDDDRSTRNIVARPGTRVAEQSRSARAHTGFSRVSIRAERTTVLESENTV